MDDKQNRLGAQNITDLVEKEIMGIFNTKTSTKEQNKKIQKIWKRAYTWWKRYVNSQWS